MDINLPANHPIFQMVPSYRPSPTGEDIANIPPESLPLPLLYYIWQMNADASKNREASKNRSVVDDGQPTH